MAVAVSGGADSLCLAWLLREARPIALVVDHGLRASSDAEAELTVRRLASFGVAADVLRLTGVGPGAARARSARYAALFEACAKRGISTLLLGHHRRDQAETVLMRDAGGSGAAGLAAMPGLAFRNELALVRPLLGVPPARLRETLRAARLDWVEDPSNLDPRALRSTLRARLDDEAGTGFEVAALADAARRAGTARRRRDIEIAGILAHRVSVFPQGHAVLTPGPIDADALAAVIRMVGGAIYPPAPASVRRLACMERPVGTLGGVRLLPAGRLGPGTLLLREAAAMAPAVAALHGATWDGRFRLEGQAPAGAMFGAVGQAAAALRRLSPWPSALLASLPAVWLDGALLAVPHLGYLTGWTKPELRVTLIPAVPAAGAAWCVDADVPWYAGGSACADGLGDAEEAACPHVRD